MRWRKAARSPWWQPTHSVSPATANKTHNSYFAAIRVLLYFLQTCFYGNKFSFFDLMSSKWHKANQGDPCCFSVLWDWWHMAHGSRPRNKHRRIKHSWRWGRTPLVFLFVRAHITFFPCGSSVRQGNCLGCVEFSKQKCMTSDHTLPSGWGFGWVSFGILTTVPNKDPLLFDYISQLWESGGGFFLCGSFLVNQAHRL